MPNCELTPREREVLALVGQGLSNKQIAARLVLSDSTVRYYCSVLHQKLFTDGIRGALVLAARQWEETVKSKTPNICEYLAVR